MKTPNTGALVGWAFVLVLAVLALFLVPWGGGDAITPVSKTDKSRVAESLLARTLSGPAYFQSTPASDSNEPGPSITPAEALRQLPVVSATRHLSAQSQQELAGIIADLTEDPPSRITGDARINLARLNLSLDKLAPR